MDGKKREIRKKDYELTQFLSGEGSQTPRGEIPLSSVL